MQLAAYKILIEEQGQPVEEFHVLRIPKNQERPTFHHSYWDTLPPEAWEAFVCALKVERYAKVLKELL